jgi:Leucine-rich repeat (LRR) protein
MGFSDCDSKSSESHPAEFRALQDFFESTAGLDWVYTGKGKPWFQDDNFCNWIGITCTASCGVSGISLPEFSLKGHIPDPIGNLQSLSDLNLDRNSLMGTIPSSICSTPIERLSLNSNQLSGELPTWMGNGCHKLSYLYLENNLFRGNIAALADKLLIVQAFLNNNQFTGEVPVFSK